MTITLDAPAKGHVTEVTKGLGGRTTTGEPDPKDTKPAPKKADARYAPNTEALSAKVLAAREQVGRPALAEFMGVNQSTCWRWERSKIQPSELEAVKTAAAKLDRLPAKAKGKGSKVAQAVARIDEVQSALSDPSKGSKVDVPKLLAELRAILDPS